MSAQSLRPLDELLWSWPTVCKAATNDWAKSFAQSIQRQSRRPNWMPTPKQHVLMQRMVAEVYRQRGDFDDCDDFPLIED
ncbi:hypothetical protein GL279_07460 [Paracoccus limosus]|jgi:hypothetical protein|uniref:Uncharacterized protein n=1 Tax=Paracoccus limosus TaxID=913252 RepID=A0A844H0R1_9RHOB|nr:hypothetical protein [Paracoccus limosus]MTH34432.1 hypothetical protein [Paracoccus limosus]